MLPSGLPQNRKAFYATIVAQLKAVCKQRNIILSRYSNRLLALAVEAWFEDPLRFKSSTTLSRKNLTNLAVRIFQEALDDPHIRYETDRRGEISFSTLLLSLGNAGRTLLGDIVEDKGFW